MAPPTMAPPINPAATPAATPRCACAGACAEMARVAAAATAINALFMASPLLIQGRRYACRGRFHTLLECSMNTGRAFSGRFRFVAAHNQPLRDAEEEREGARFSS